ncbi:DUF2306 domain-containing protein [Actinophytocola gossypii]|uniref:DUF2306 domain-containing protein n=1 Tax=Actinophytocola gossypii TaxID=2812003 RepID=A0ABT2J270_9PSEU|nr:DUF2306 domain-containing protein [Actinophytocola gossypii]MCT2581957.1 DUF2306 domain-containing protein [Actinophytocola gossypii]
MLIVAFLAVSLPPYVTLDPANSLVPINVRVALHYPMLLGHILFGTITLATVCVQLWPWLRRTHPKAHRISGRTYVFAGMLPSCALALAVVPLGELNPLGAIGASVWAVIGLVTTLRGYAAGRARHTRDHRRWMLYSFAAAMGIVTGRVLFLAVPAIPGVPHAPEVIHPLAGFWLGWMVNLAVAYWWLHRRPARVRRSRARARANR